MRRLYVDGHALWPAGPGAPRPAPAGLSPNERRRASEGVLVALHVAEQAVAMAGADAASLPSVFTSAHGDLGIVDALAATLAADPLLLSPTRFHHSVHNAASGYWSIASGSTAASTALAAYDASFAAGLLEAACQASADARAVLLVGFDTAARGLLAEVNTSRGLLGAACVLSPVQGPRSRFALDWALADEPVDLPTPDHPLAANALADALPFFALLAAGGGTLALPLGTNALHLRLASLRNPAGIAG